MSFARLVFAALVLLVFDVQQRVCAKPYRPRPHIQQRQQQPTTYTIAQNYTGATFFDGWNFKAGVDDTNWGNVMFLGNDDAKNQSLTYVNQAGNAVIKVDNTTVGTSDIYGRASIYMQSAASFTVGSLILFQATHMPYGCGIWPGFWSLGGNKTNWPLYGEIDIVENVNAATINQYSLHTEQGCTHPAPVQPPLETGNVGHLDCWNMTLYNTGCIVQETKPNNYGAGFAANGGGAYAVQWNDEAIRFWFFPRGAIPADFSSDSPNPSGWGIPSGYYPQSSCNFAQHFGPQALILDIDICGLYAGDPNIYNAGGFCTGLCTDLIHNPMNFNTAYFEIEFLRVFVEGNGTISPIPSPSSSGTSSLPTSTPPAGGVQNGNGSGAAQARISAVTLWLPIVVAGITIGFVSSSMWML